MFSFFNQTFTANMNLKERIFILPLIKVSFNTYVITNPINIDTMYGTSKQTSLRFCFVCVNFIPPEKKTTEIQH